MRIIFIGSGELGLPALKKLAPEICCVVTAPDKPAGRGLKPLSTPIKTLARSLNLPVIETADINHPEIITKLKSCRPEIMLVAAFGQMLEKTVLEISGKGVFNIHPSLLPRYRGAAPVEHAILNREQETGVTIIAVTRRMDAGPILTQRKVAIRPDEDTPALSGRLAKIGAELAADGLRQVENGTAVLTPQAENTATYAAKITKRDGLIDWNKDATEIAAKVRAFIRWPRAYTYFPLTPHYTSPLRGEDKGEGDKKTLLMIWKAVPINKKYPATTRPGTVLKADKNGVEVACGQGAILLTELQAAGKKRLPAEEFIRGVRFTENTVLG
ncbi:MAG: methionyl-tRNA formyltransferase [Candidatus Omnitrophota bacterium]|nr:methionyl-tRNA formyltransferase [Candidatus Omnitrophota bacterium]